MADETKDQDATSNNGNIPSIAPISQQQEAEPEVHILEEHVTHAAQKPVTRIPSAPALPIPTKPALGDDIAKILAEVKLPERRNAEISGERHVASESASLSVDENGPREAEAMKNPSSVTAVHTLKNDLQDVVQNQKISLVRAVSLEEDRRTHKTIEPIETSSAQKRSRRTFGTLFAILILIGLGAAAISGVALIMNQQNNAPPVDIRSSILFAEQSATLSIDAESSSDLKRTLGAGRTSSEGTLGSITHIIPFAATTLEGGTIQHRAATFKEFMAAIGAHPPDDLLRALGDDFFLGIHVVDKSSPILVIPVTSHDHAFAAMLAWEGNLNTDLSPLFTPVPIFTKDRNGLPIKRTYEDLIMRNYDVRALKDDTGTIQLYYSFPTQDILVIAESPYSFPEILSRLHASNQL